MKSEQTKNLLINIMTGVVIVGVLFAGYYVFSAQNKTPSPTADTQASSVTQIASETALIGSEIESTVSSLQDLKTSVANSSVIFSSPAFQNLVDFTAPVPSQSVGGRTNPFLPTDWKARLDAITSSKQTATGGI